MALVFAIMHLYLKKSSLLLLLSIHFFNNFLKIFFKDFNMLLKNKTEVHDIIVS